MSFSEGTTVTTPFPVPGYGFAGTDRVQTVQKLQALTTKRAAGGKRYVKRRSANRYYADLRVCTGVGPLSPVIQYRIFPVKPSSWATDDEDQVEVGEEPDNLELDSLYATLLVDASRAHARGDSTRPAGQANPIWFWKHTALNQKTRETEADVTLLREFLTSARQRTAAGIKGHGKTTPPTEAPPMIAEVVPVAVGSPQWDSLTARRAALIRKKNREGLTASEVAEFAKLQTASRAAISAAFPKPPLDPKHSAALNKAASADEDAAPK